MWLLAQCVGRARERTLARVWAEAQQAAADTVTLRLALDEAKRGLVEARQTIAEMQARDEDRQAQRRPAVVLTPTSFWRLH